MNYRSIENELSSILEGFANGEIRREDLKRGGVELPGGRALSVDGTVRKIKELFFPPHYAKKEHPKSPLPSSSAAELDSEEPAQVDIFSEEEIEEDEWRGDEINKKKIFSRSSNSDMSSSPSSNVSGIVCRIEPEYQM